MNKILFTKVVAFNTSCNASDSGKEGASRIIENKTIVKTDKFEENLSDYAVKNKCEIVSKGYYSPAKIKGLFDDVESYKSALVYCRKKDLGILIYIADNFNPKTSILSCPRYISSVPENENMGLVFRNDYIFSGLEKEGLTISVLKENGSLVSLTRFSSLLS